MTASTEPQAQDDQTLGAIGRILTWGRMAWLIIVLGFGAATGAAGYLIGEGSARAAFELRHQDHEKRILSVESALRVSIDQNTRVIGLLGEVQGELRAVRGQLMGRSDR